jgi:hypothetical protein
MTSEDRSGDEERGAVSLMTVHAAKGLEFEHVFLAGLEDGLFPHQRSIDGGDAELEEERRLMYVALTRARQRLYLSSCMVRTVQGEMRDQEVSRFLHEIPSDLVDARTEPRLSSWLDGSSRWPGSGGDGGPRRVRCRRARAGRSVGRTDLGSVRAAGRERDGVRGRRVRRGLVRTGRCRRDRRGRARGGCARRARALR